MTHEEKNRILKEANAKIAELRKKTGISDEDFVALCEKVEKTKFGSIVDGVFVPASPEAQVSIKTSQILMALIVLYVEKGAE